MENYKELLVNLNNLANQINEYEIKAQDRLKDLDEKLVNNKILFNKQQDAFNKLVNETQNYENAFKNTFSNLAEVLKNDLTEFIDGVIKDKLSKIENTLLPVDNKILQIDSLIKTFDNRMSENTTKLTTTIEGLYDKYKSNTKEIEEYKNDLMNFTGASTSSVITKQNLESTLINIIMDVEKSKKVKYSIDEVYSLIQNISERIG